MAKEIRRMRHLKYHVQVDSGSLDPRACQGKEKRTQENAERYVRNSGNPFLVAYRCKICKHFHVGHARGSRNEAA